jgi:hypothetical protein
MSENSKNNPLKEVSIKVDTDNIKAEMKKLTDAESRIRELEAEAEENKQYKEFYDKNTGIGTVSMTPDMREKEINTRNNQKEFDSVEDLIEYCRLNDKESYEKIKAKSFEAIPKNNFEWVDKFDENGDSLIMRTVKRMNSDYRKKIRG